MKTHEKTFEQAIRDNISKDGIVGSMYMVRVNCDCDDGMNIYIRPDNREGETIDFIVKGNNLVNATHDFDEQRKNKQE